MIKTRYQIVIEDKPQRFVGSPSKGRVVPAGDGLDFPDEFASESDAHNRATRFGLLGYSVIPVSRDIGTPTNLNEIGF